MALNTALVGMTWATNAFGGGTMVLDPASKPELLNPGLSFRKTKELCAACFDRLGRHANAPAHHARHAVCTHIQAAGARRGARTESALVA